MELCHIAVVVHKLHRILAAVGIVLQDDTVHILDLVVLKPAAARGLIAAFDGYAVAVQCGAFKHALGTFFLGSAALFKEIKACTPPAVPLAEFRQKSFPFRWFDDSSLSHIGLLRAYARGARSPNSQVIVAAAAVPIKNIHHIAAVGKANRK